MGSATTATTRLWRACNWLISEAKTNRQLGEALNVVLYLIDQLRAGRNIADLINRPAPHETGGGPHTHVGRRHQRPKG